MLTKRGFLLFSLIKYKIDILNMIFFKVQALNINDKKENNLKTLFCLCLLYEHLASKKQLRRFNKS